MSHGGKRSGAGRPKKEASKVMRVPLSKVTDVQAILMGEPQLIPLYGSTVRAGFPSPADDYIEDKLDLNDYLIKHPASTFLVRAQGNSMVGAGITPGDILVVDRSLEATHNRIVIAAVNGELTVKRLSKQKGQVQLLSENPDFPPIEVSEERGDQMVIWGIVTNIIKKLP